MIAPPPLILLGRQWIWVALFFLAVRVLLAPRPPALRGVRRMNDALRYWRLLRVQVRSSVLLGLQYRADFILDGVVSLF